MNDLHTLLQVLLLVCCPSTLLFQALSTGESLIIRCTHRLSKGDMESGIFYLKFQAWSNVDNFTHSACLMGSLSGSAANGAIINPNCGYDPKHLDLKTEGYSHGIMEARIRGVTEHNFGTYQCEWKENMEFGYRARVVKTGKVKLNAINVAWYIHYTNYDSSRNLILNILFSPQRRNASRLVRRKKGSPVCESCWQGHVQSALIPSGIITLIFFAYLNLDCISEKFHWLKNKISRFRNSS